MTRISRLTMRISSVGKPAFKSRSGFTLIEILVVVALIGLIMSIAVPNATLALKVNISNSTRELASTIRSTYDEAVLKGQVYRLAFDIEKREYWVEQGDKDFLLKTAEQQEAEDQRLARLSDEERAKHKDPFVLARNVTKKKKSLPKGVHFKDIITAHTKDATTGGMVYAHVFPHGFVEKLVIHLKDDYERETTLLVNSVNGKSRMFERYVTEE